MQTEFPSVLGFPAWVLSGTDPRADRSPLGDAQSPQRRKPVLPWLPQLTVFHFAKAKPLSLKVILPFHNQSSPFPAHQSCIPIWVSRLLLGVSILDLLRALDTVTTTTRNSTKVFTCRRRAIEPNNLLESQLRRGDTFLLGTQ